MEFITEDVTYLAGGLCVLAGALLVAMKVTQQGKYLIAAGASLGLALLAFGVETLWVTDNERIEAAVYGLGRSVAGGDVPGVLDRLTPDAQFVAGGLPLPASATRDRIEGAVAGTHFDFLRVTHLRANAGGQSRRGTAEFRVVAGGSVRGAVNDLNFATSNSTWSLGFQETAPGVWKVSRITPVSLPGGRDALPALGRF